MRRAVIVDIVRSPFGRGRPGGALAGVHPVDLYAEVLRALVRRTGVDPALIEDVITGCVIQVAEQSGNIGRQAVLAAGFPESVPAVTLDRKCGSAQQAFDFAAQGVIAGAYDVVVAGGVEMMSLVPMRVNRMGKDNEGPAFHVRYPQGLVRQGVSAELIAARFGISREAMDAFALASHQRAIAAEDRGATARSIAPVEVPSAEGTLRIERDEGPRRETSLEKLAALKPAFEDAEIKARFPEIRWSVTAGNSSQVTDGASAALIAEESVAARLGLKPRAAITHFALAGDDPIMMLTAIIPATRKLLARAGLGIERIDSFEVNEAFASVVLAWAKETGADPERVNRWGGAIALGRYGVQTMCESGGMANATLIERLA
jgi:acetyl-CoA acyltransferase